MCRLLLPGFSSTRWAMQTVHGDNLRDELLLPGINEQEAHLNLSGLSLYSHGGGWRREDGYNPL